MENNIWRLNLERLRSGMTKDEILQTFVRDADCTECSDHHVCPDCVISLITTQQGNGQNDGTSELVDEELDLDSRHKIKEAVRSLLMCDQVFTRLLPLAPQPNFQQSFFQQLIQNRRAGPRRRVLSYIPSFKVEVYARLHQINPLNDLAQWSVFLDPYIMADFIKRTKMLESVSTEFGMMTLVAYHNLSFPNDHIQYITVEYGRFGDEPVKNSCVFKEKEAKKYIQLVQTETRNEDTSVDQHFAVLYYDLENGLVQYADSIHRFAYERNIRRIAEKLGMTAYTLEKLSEDRVEYQVKTNSCGIHSIANAYMFLKYGSNFPTVHIKAFKIRDQLGQYLWDVLAMNDQELNKASIFGADDRRVSYSEEPTSEDENDFEEELDQDPEKREPIQNVLRMMKNRSEVDDFIGSGAVTPTFPSGPSSSSVAQYSEERNQQNMVPNERFFSWRTPYEIPDSPVSGTSFSTEFNKTASQFGSIWTGTGSTRESGTVSEPNANVLIPRTYYKDPWLLRPLQIDTQLSEAAQASSENNRTSGSADERAGWNSSDKTDGNISRNFSFQPPVSPIISLDVEIDAQLIEAAQASSENGVGTNGSANEQADWNFSDTNNGDMSRNFSFQTPVSRSLSLDVCSDPLSVTSHPALQKSSLNGSPQNLDEDHFSSNHSEASPTSPLPSHQAFAHQDLMHNFNQVPQQTTTLVFTPDVCFIPIAVKIQSARPNYSNAPSNGSKTSSTSTPSRRQATVTQIPVRRSTRVPQAPKRTQKDNSPHRRDSPVSSPKKTKTTWGLYTKGERNDDRLTRQKTKAMRKELGEKNPPQEMFIGRLDQYVDLSGNTHPYRHVPYEDLKKAVLAAVKPKEDVWKNPRIGYHNEAAWVEIGRAVYARTLKYEEIKPLQQILENTKRSLRRKISELVSEDLSPGEMEKQLKLWKGYEECKYLRESVYEQKRESRLRDEHKKLKEQQKKEPMTEKKEKKPKKK